MQAIQQFAGRRSLPGKLSRRVRERVSGAVVFSTLQLQCASPK
jgi:hypothetical protein